MQIPKEQQRVNEIISKYPERIRPQIPYSAFNNKTSSLETCVKYLRENLGMRFCDISRLLNRSPSTIVITYKKAVEKYPKQFRTEFKDSIPAKILKDRRYSVLETIVMFLKPSHTLSEIAVLLKRDTRTIWTVYQRAKKKDER